MKKYKIKMWYEIPRQIDRKKYVNERYRDTDYMNLYFFENHDEMYNFVDKKEEEKVERDYSARCYTELKRYWEIDTETGEMTPTNRYSPMCGNLYFVKDDYGVSTISHECLHAVIGYFARKIKDPKRVIDTNYDIDSIESNNTPCDDIEELICYMHGGLVKQVWNYHFKMTDECIDKKSKKEYNNIDE